MGNRTRQCCYGVAMLGVLFVACASWGQYGNAPDSQLVVAVYDDAGVAPEIVLRAEAQANRVFREAGIDVQWRNLLWEAAPGLGPLRAQEKSTRLMVRIVPRSRDLKGEIFGLAFLDDDGRGRQADIFYSGIAKLSANGSHDTALLLGSVMAHELGHLLLGSHSHSSTGIMRGRWDQDVLQLAAAGRDGFSAEQAGRMQERIASFANTDAAVVSEARDAGNNPRREKGRWIADLR
jgi:hypothetical protein